MASPKFPVTTDLQHTIEQKPNLAEVHFTADGHYHFTAHECNKNLYTRLREVPKKTPSGIVIPKQFEHVPIQDIRGKDDERFLIVQTCTREEVLAATPVDKVAAPLIAKADILASIGITEDELKEFFNSRKKK